MINVPLDEWEWTLIHKLAHSRLEVIRKSGYHRAPANGKDPEYIEFLGVAGEIAFYKLVDRFPIISQSADHSSTPDIIIGGYEIDIKGVEIKEKGLMVSTAAKRHYDLYVLMEIREPVASYVGYYFGEALFRKKVITPSPTSDGQERKPYYRTDLSELYTDTFWIA